MSEPRMSPLTTCERNVDSKWAPSSIRCAADAPAPSAGRTRRGRIGYRPGVGGVNTRGGGGRCPPPPECLRWFARTVTSALEAARRALDRGEVVTLDRV